MAYVGPWGQFIHIPKCAGISMRYYLRHEHGEYGQEVGTKHDLPNTVKNAFTIIRHPAHWLRSFYTYYSQHNWRWEELPQYVNYQFSFANTNGLSWMQYVTTVTATNPGAVGKVFDYYCVPGVKVYKMEELVDHFPGINKKHSTHDKPVMTLEDWETICNAELDTLFRYGYTDMPYFL